MRVGAPPTPPTTSSAGTSTASAGVAIPVGAGCATAYPAAIARLSSLPLAIAIALLCASVAGGAAAGAAGDRGPTSSAGQDAQKPKLTDVRCLAHCAGARRSTVDGQVRLRGRHLAGVTEVIFPGESTEIVAAPDATERRKVEVTIPVGAISGRPRARTSTGAEARSRKPLRIVDVTELPTGFRLRESGVRPKRAFFDERGGIRLRYLFEAAERTGVRIQLSRKQGKRAVRSWREPNQLPYAKHSSSWNGLTGDRDAAPDGRYRFRVGPFGGPSKSAGSVRLHGHRFPVRGSHGYGGSLQSFGAPRSGGRRHQGQDVYAACGTRLEAARGGEVKRRAYDPQLYGHYVVIDGFKTKADHLYSHMTSPSRFKAGDRVHTGQRIGSVGKSGNARTTPCHLHFEIWPRGWRSGSPVNPMPSLRRWDRWS